MLLGHSGGRNVSNTQQLNSRSRKVQTCYKYFDNFWTNDYTKFLLTMILCFELLSEQLIKSSFLTTCLSGPNCQYFKT